MAIGPFDGSAAQEKNLLLTGTGCCCCAGDSAALQLTSDPRKCDKSRYFEHLFCCSHKAKRVNTTRRQRAGPEPSSAREETVSTTNSYTGPNWWNSHLHMIPITEQCETMAFHMWFCTAEGRPAVATDPAVCSQMAPDTQKHTCSCSRCCLNQCQSEKHRTKQQNI